eukprot:544119-Prymnesium_polylepis.1
MAAAAAAPPTVTRPRRAPSCTRLPRRSRALTWHSHPQWRHSRPDMTLPRLNMAGGDLDSGAAAAVDRRVPAHGPRVGLQAAAARGERAAGRHPLRPAE